MPGTRLSGKGTSPGGMFVENYAFEVWLDWANQDLQSNVVDYPEVDGTAAMVGVGEAGSQERGKGQQIGRAHV